MLRILTPSGSFFCFCREKVGKKEKYWIELDEVIANGYSCITSIDENTIGILYEGSQAQMTFQKINLKGLF